MRDFYGSILLSENDGKVEEWRERICMCQLGRILCILGAMHVHSARMGRCAPSECS